MRMEDNLFKGVHQVVCDLEEELKVGGGIEYQAITVSRGQALLMLRIGINEEPEGCYGKEEVLGYVVFCIDIVVNK